MSESLPDGKICYIQIPAVDIAVSSAFYEAALGWRTRRRSDGEIAFDDGPGTVSGTWITGRPPMTEAGYMIYVFVADIEKAMAAITANGGEIVAGIGCDPGEITAKFRDPAGNLMGLYSGPAPSPPERSK